MVLLKWRIMRIMLANGIINKDMVEANRYGVMDLYMKDIFKMIWLMVVGD